MLELTAQQLADASGSRLLRANPQVQFPTRVVIDSRQVGPGDLFVGLVGSNSDGGEFAEAALKAGAWGVLVGDGFAQAAVDNSLQGAVLATDQPLLALQRLATHWRRALGCKVVGICGAVGKTSTKDILAALLAKNHRVHKTPGNYNTEIGLPLTVLSAPAGTEVLVLEMAMRGRGQIAELTQIAEPDVGIILNIGPEHLELLGSLEEVAAAEAELIENLPAGAAVVTPVDEPLLKPHLGLRDDIRYATFQGEKSDPFWADAQLEGVAAWHQDENGSGSMLAMIECFDRIVDLDLPFLQGHLLENTIASVAAAELLGLGIEDGELEVELSPLRGERIHLAESIIVINDCYNANPLSNQAAVEDLVSTAIGQSVKPRGRRVAVLGDMLELGEDAQRYHQELGQELQQRGIELVIAVGPLAAEIGTTYSGNFQHVTSAQQAAALLQELIQPNDTVLVKGSRGIGLEVVADELKKQLEAVN